MGPARFVVLLQACAGAEPSVEGVASGILDRESDLVRSVWAVEGNLDDVELGQEVSGGDVNGDGFGDLLVTSAGWLADRKSLLVYHGSEGGLGKRPATTMDTGDRLFANASFVGDVNGDGFDDVVIANPTADSPDGTNDGGVLFLHLGSPTGLDETQQVVNHTGDESENLGSNFAGGDVNGDGFDDLVVAGRRIYVYFGSPSGLKRDPLVVGEDGPWWSSVAVADVNGDGLDDIVVGALTWYDDMGNMVGLAVSFHGSPSGPADQKQWQVEGTPPGINFAHGVHAVGDLDGDGYDDVLVEAQGPYLSPVNGPGRLELYRGSPAGLEDAPAWVQTRIPAAGAGILAVAAPGDVNGDAVPDVIVGNPQRNGAIEDIGVLWVYAGPLTHHTVEQVVAVGPHEQEFAPRFGSSVASVDVDGDGVSEIAASAPRYDSDSGDDDAGLVVLFDLPQAVP